MNGIVKCRLEDLKIGDKVLIEHATSYEKNEGWVNFRPIYYYFKYEYEYEYEFVNCEYERESFLLSEKRNDKGSVKFIGRCLTDDEIRLKKINSIFLDESNNKM